jgi:hypothetical protein
MGLDQLYPIGTVLTRRVLQDDAWDEIRVVGAGSELVVTSNKEFTESKTLNVQEAREDYDGDVEHEASEEEEGKVILVRPGATPEQVFAAEARAAAARGEVPKGRQGRKRSDPPAPLRDGGE